MDRKTQKEFDEKYQCMIDHYSNYTIKQINTKLDGEYTLKENAADIGGAKLAYHAYSKFIID